MSKIGKTPITLPSGVTVKVENNKVIIQGAKSKKEVTVDQNILKVIVADNKVFLEPVDKKNANKRKVYHWVAIYSSYSSWRFLTNQR